VAYGQIALALKLRHYATSLSHTSSSPIVPGSPTGDLTTVGARHLAVDRPSRALSDQIDPATMIPYCNALNLGVDFLLLFLTKFRRYSLSFSRFAPSSQFKSNIVTGVYVMCKQNLSVMGVASC
jgi:hypothetical protein